MMKRTRVHQFPKSVLGFGCLLGCFACHSPTNRPTAVPLEHNTTAHDRRIEMDGAVLLSEYSKRLERQQFDPESLFQIALSEEEQDRKAGTLRAMAAYAHIIDYFPTSVYAMPARFNLGLLHEAEGEFGEAAKLYEVVQKGERPDDSDDAQTWLHALFRYGHCLHQLEAYWEAVAVYDRLLELEDLDRWDRFEGLSRRAFSIYAAEPNEVAEAALSSALSHFYREVGRSERHALAAEAALYLGDIGLKRYQTVALEFPVALMKQRLEEKCAALLSAQARYIRAVRHGTIATAARAGYNIGSMYEDLHQTLLGLEAPSDLNPQARKLYQQQVRERIRILVRKALGVYQMALGVSKQLGDDDWVRRLKVSIDRLQEQAGPNSSIASG